MGYAQLYENEQKELQILQLTLLDISAYFEKMLSEGAQNYLLCSQNAPKCTQYALKMILK